MFKQHHARRPRAAGLLSPVLCLALAGLLCAPPPRAASAQGGTPPPQEQAGAHHHQPPPPAAAEEGKSNPVRIPDVACLDQDGRKLRFYTDLVKGKVVVLNFIFTTCTYMCLRLGESTVRLQAALGERAGRDVHLISVSTDPVTDTPERLKAWAKQMHARPGWTLVTGEKAELDKLLKVLTGDSSRQGTHSPLVLIGNEQKGLWVEGYALANPARLIQQIDGVSGGRAAPR